jgi:hypothetical protein
MKTAIQIFRLPEDVERWISAVMTLKLGYCHPAGSKAIEEAVSAESPPRNSRLLALIKDEE